MKRERKLPNAEILAKELTENNGNMLELARKYGVADRSIADSLKKHGLPYHSADYRPNLKHSRYKKIYSPGHPRADENGFVLEHILVAEKMLGRSIKTTEAVHHKDGNKFNNEKDNLIVFASHSDHVRYHNSKYAEIYKDGDVWKTELPIETKKCMNCGKLFHPNNKKEERNRKFCCHKCAVSARRITTNKPIEDIINLIKENNGNMTAVGRIYNVTANAIVKMLKKNNLPYHSKDYK